MKEFSNAAQRRRGEAVLARATVFARYCRPCGGTDANVLTDLRETGRCEHCGAADQALFHCPRRPLPGLGGVR